MRSMLFAVALLGGGTNALLAQETYKFESGGQCRKLSNFSGVETRFATYNYVESNCSSGPIPDVRLVRKPTSGDIRFEPVTIPLARDKSDHRAHCNGMDVNGMGGFYKSKEGFVGEDRFVVDVDYKRGTVRRFSYVVNVR